MARYWAAAAPIVLFMYVTWFRVDGISSTFMLLADQMRDWTAALVPAQDLPLTGAPSLAGGRSLGPIYYWVLWLSRVTIGPFVDNLPHAGGIGLSLLQSAADVALFLALRRLWGAALAGAVVLLVATAPFDAAVTASIWNPQVAVAFSKCTVALVLLDTRPDSRARQLLIAAAAWLAVQAHISAVFLAAGVFAWLVGRHLVRRRLRPAAWAALDVVTVIFLLQVPYVLHHVIYGAARGGGPGRAMRVAADLLMPGVASRLFDSASTLSTYAGGMLLEPWRGSWVWVLWLAAVAVAVGLGARHGWRWVAVTVVPIGAAIVVWAPFRDRSDYWYLPLAPLVAIMAGLAVATWFGPAGRRRLGWVALALVVAAQPARFMYSRLLGRVPAYGVMVAGARQIVASGIHPSLVSLVEPSPGTDPEYLVIILGGQIDRRSNVRAEILPSGRVRYVRDTP